MNMNVRFKASSIHKIYSKYLGMKVIHIICATTINRPWRNCIYIYTTTTAASKNRGHHRGVDICIYSGVVGWKRVWSGFCRDERERPHRGWQLSMYQSRDTSPRLLFSRVLHIFIYRYTHFFTINVYACVCVSKDDFREYEWYMMMHSWCVWER